MRGFFVLMETRHASSLRVMMFTEEWLLSPGKYGVCRGLAAGKMGVTML